MLESTRADDIDTNVELQHFACMFKLCSKSTSSTALTGDPLASGIARFASYLYLIAGSPVRVNTVKTLVPINILAVCYACQVQYDDKPERTGHRCNS